MSLDLVKPLSVPKARPPMPLGLRLGIVALVVVLVVGGAKAWESGFRPARLWEPRREGLATVDVERGDLAVYVHETGTLESASNTTVRCQVEALVGVVGGSSTKGQGGAASSQGGASQGGGGASTSATSAGGGASGVQAASKSGGSSAKTSKSTTTKKRATASSAGGGSSSGGGSGGSSGGGMSGSGGGGSSGGGSSGGGSSGGGGSGGSSGGGGGSGGSQAPVAKKPTIRSFSYAVPAYTSLRSATKSGGAQAKSGGSRGGGVGGGNRGGGGGGMGGQAEMAGSTRIISIRPEGEPVAAGEVVCELDSSAFQDEVIAQKIRYDQAKAWVTQARSILEVNEISLREYRDGIYKQDLQLVRQYLSSCRTEEDRARNNLTWSKEVYLKGFRALSQYQADGLAMERSEIALGEAERMERRLVDFTGPKILKSLEAKLEANRADSLAQAAAFQLESDRLKRLEKAVQACTLRAPHEGIVVYSLPPSNGWRPATAVIMEGATVREGQAIFELPDAKKMRVRARVNESKVGSVHVGQKATIRIDAFSDQPLDGTVTSVTVIPAPNGMASDIRIYFATVAIDSGGFEGLRPGLSAEVSFFVDGKPETTRLPLQAVRWVDNHAFAAVSTSSDRTTYRWQPLKVGLMNDAYAEILDGLKPGDKVVARPEGLPAPSLTGLPVVQADGNDTRTRG